MLIDPSLAATAFVRGQRYALALIMLSDPSLAATAFVRGQRYALVTVNGR